jgi:hypothetical protein
VHGFVVAHRPDHGCGWWPAGWADGPPGERGGQDVSGVEGVVTVERASQFWMQDPTPDSDEATSDGILVFGSGVGRWLMSVIGYKSVVG